MVHKNRSTEGSPADLFHYLILIHSRLRESDPQSGTMKRLTDPSRASRRTASASRILFVLEDKASLLSLNPNSKCLAPWIDRSDPLQLLGSHRIKEQQLPFQGAEIQNRHCKKTKPKEINPDFLVRLELTRRNRSKRRSQSSPSNTQCLSAVGSPDLSP